MSTAIDFDLDADGIATLTIDVPGQSMNVVNEAFRAGVLGQQESYAKGEAQAVIEAFLAKRGGAKS